MVFIEPVVMGILNITPDSFFDGGELYRDNKKNLDLILKRALQMQGDGASILDVGGESTRPGAQRVTEQEELDRVIPVIATIKNESNICLSVDTSKVAVMREAIQAGATFINDVCALQQENTLHAVATEIKNGNDLQVCLMHMQNNPQTMQANPAYQNVIEEVLDFLQQRIAACEAAGVSKERLIIDPGFGFGKTLEHNLQLLRNLERLSDLACPVLVGLSRKSMIAALTGSKDPQDRLAGSLALAWASLERGAKILRVHDVKETVELLTVYRALHD